MNVNYNEVVDSNQDPEKANWRVCLSCGESLTKGYYNITCKTPYYKCDKCNIIQDGDISQLYHCCRCGKIIEKTEDLIFEFITPNWKELSFCPKPTGIKQYLCGKCHSRAIQKRKFRFKKLGRFFLIPFFIIFLIFRPRTKG